MRNNYFTTLGLLLCLLSFFNVADSRAQTQNWYFGDHAGIKFASSGPIALTNSAMLTYEGCTVLSDAGGQLLAYTNGEVVWDNQHQPMPNGSTGLGGNNSTSQGALFLPLPGGPTNKVYLFCLDAIENNLVGGLRYSILDFSLRAGLGDVTATKGVVLPTPVVGGKLTEKMTAVRHANGRDYWIVVHGWQSNAFYCFLLSPTGISTVPVVSNVGIVHSGGGSFFGAGNAVGCMRASPNGRYLALAQRDLQCEMYNFDNATGAVSNYLQLASHDYTYGVEFSPDNSKLYTTYSLDGEITQYNLLAGSPAAIVNSATVITRAERLGNLLLGPDNKIYVASYGNTFLHAIQNPNATGAACDYKRQAVSLAGRQGLNGLPTFANLYGPSYNASIANTSACAGSPTSFTGTVQPAVGGAVATWNFGDPGSGGANTATGLTPTHTYAVAGTYQVTLTVTVPGVATPLVATQAVVVAPLPQVNLGSDVVVCARQYQLAVGPQPAGSTYRWQDGSTGATYLVQASGPYSVDNGRYSVSVTSAAGCTSTAAINVTLNPVPVVYLPTDTTVCAASVVLRPRAITLAGSTYRWQDGSTGTTYLARASGRYTVAVTTGAGCTTTAAVNVTLGASPILRLPADTAACSTALLLRPTAQPAGSTYRWQDGSTSATYSARTSGRYSVTVTSAVGCTSTAAVNVTLNAQPSPRLPADTVVCAAAVLLRPGAQPAGSTYRWQDGSTGATYLAQASGLYTVVVTTPQGCTNTATGRVRLGPTLSVSLGADTTVCPNATWVVRTNPQPAGTLYRWQDGSTAATYLAHGPGQYSVEVRATATSCPASATRVATEASCPVIIPNIITPNGDRANEFFTLKGLIPKEWHLIIFDRWGRQVYDQAHYDNGWNAPGQASGVYYYLLSNAATGARYRGWVEVARGN
jgi:gliding motility-associated-like protein